MTLVVTHATVTGAVADPTAIVDGPAWDANHVLTGVASPVQGGTGVANDAASTITITGSFGITFSVSAATSLTLPTSGTVAVTSNKLSAFAATTSAELAGVISDETGSGALVFANTPTLVTPVLGVATATTINKVTITAPASAATLTIPDGVTLTGPAASGTAMTLGNAETVTGAKTFGSAGAVGKLKIAGTTSGSTILDATATASGTLTLPAATDTLVGLATTDTLTNKTLTSPKLTTPVGGTAAGSTLTINGTSSGSPSAAYLLLQTNGQFVGIGQSTPLAMLHVGAGADTPSMPFTPQLYVSAAGDAAFSVRDSTNNIEFGMFTNTSAGGLVAFGSRTSHPVWVQTNGANTHAFHVSGGFSVGSTTDPGTNALSVGGISTLTGAVTGSSSIKSTNATAGIGYGTGAGGTQTQLTSKTTGVTLNTVCGAVTMNNAALVGGAIVSFVLTNSAIAATDVLVLNHISAGTPGSYTLNARAAAGSATIDVRNNTGGSLSEAIVIQFVVIKGVNS